MLLSFYKGCVLCCKNNVILPLFRLKDAMVKAKGMKLFAKKNLEDALKRVYCTPADLSGYIKLSDNILYRILEHCEREGDPDSKVSIDAMTELEVD